MKIKPDTLSKKVFISRLIDKDIYQVYVSCKVLGEKFSFYNFFKTQQEAFEFAEHMRKNERIELSFWHYLKVFLKSRLKVKDGPYDKSMAEKRYDR